MEQSPMLLSASGAPAGFSYALQGNGDLWVLQGATAMC